MTTGIFIWLTVFAIAALLFFGIALVIIILGMRDLKILLSKSEILDSVRYKIKQESDDKTF